VEAERHPFGVPEHEHVYGEWVMVWDHGVPTLERHCHAYDLCGDRQVAYDLSRRAIWSLRHPGFLDRVVTGVLLVVLVLLVGYGIYLVITHA
jgi:hypothetical protein